MQKKIYINEYNINIIFGPGNPDDILCYEKILNLCRQKVTKYFGATQDFLQKEELSYLTLYRVYSAFKNKLNRLKQNNENVELFFYLSQLYSYVDLAAKTQVMIYKNYEKKIKRNTLEFQECVNYAEPLDNFIGHSISDFVGFEIQDNLEQTHIEENDNITTTNNEENADNNEDDEIQKYIKTDFGCELLRDKDGEYRAHAGLENYILDNSLDKKEKEIGFDFLEYKLHKYFSVQELQLMKSIYFNDETYFQGTKKEYNAVLNSIINKVSSKNNYLRYKVLRLLKEKRAYGRKATNRGD